MTDLHSLPESFAISSPHHSVLLRELVTAMNLTPGDSAVDCTVGAGGHTQAMLAAVGSTGLVIGLDRDQSALALATSRLSGHVAAGCLRLVHRRFSEIETVAREQNLFGKIAAIAADIGVSSMHLDDRERGFSFMGDGPLDMRMDPSTGISAAELLASASEEDLIKLFRDYGEEPKAKQVARRIVQTRSATPLVSTAQLADLVKAAAAYPTASRKHPATRVFQALRIAVNDELGELTTMLNGAFAALRPGGRLAVISFHSLEDRIVKNTFIGLTGRRERAAIPRDLPYQSAELDQMVKARAEIIKPFPTLPADAEIAGNSRARSAKLRVITKIN